MSVSKNLSASLLLVTLLAGSGRCAGSDGSGWLEWNSTNNTSVRARFVAFDGKTLTLEKENGSKLVVDIDKLDIASRKQAAAEVKQAMGAGIGEVGAMTFMKITAGVFTMGSPIDEKYRVTNGQDFLNLTAGSASVPLESSQWDHETERRVTLSDTFWMKKTEVTWDEWKSARDHAAGYGYLDIGEGRNGYEGDGSGTHPVTEITWLDAVKWCNLMSQIENKNPVYHLTGDFDGSAFYKNGNQQPVVNWEANGYRLPTEAEWEFACRGGRNAARPFYGVLEEIAWFAGNSGGNTHPVGTKTKISQKFGLDDMHGNVSEWCWDWSGPVMPGEARDPRGSDKGVFRVARGGSWADPERSCRAAYRGTFSPYAPSSVLVGFRPVCSSDPAATDSP